MPNPTSLSDDELLSSIEKLIGSQRRLTAMLVRYLLELEERRLHLRQACSSMFDFCTTRLGMSEGEAFRRITAARLAKKFPIVLELIASGAIHLSALTLLREHVTEENHQELLRDASGQSKREVQALLARRFPKPDVAGTIRKLPGLTKPDGRPESPLALETTNTAEPIRDQAPRQASVPVCQSRVEPLSEARYKVQFSVGAELKEKLERARNLLSHENPSGDLATIVERALDVLLAKLEREKLAKAKAVQRARSAKPGAVTRAARRAVFARDGLRCAFVDEKGRRCKAEAFLEIDHVQARALGGSGATENLRVLCRAHNRLHAERTFGREHVEQRIHLRQEKRCRNEVAKRDRKDGAIPDDPYAKAFKALTHLGFQGGETRRALEKIRASRGATTSPVPIEELLREGLQLLTEHCYRVSDVARSRLWLRKASRSPSPFLSP